MPVYDYLCLDCRKRFDVFLTYQEYGHKRVSCTYCQGSNIQRRVPRVRVLKSDENRLAALNDPGALDGLEDDPRALGRMMKDMQNMLGEEMHPAFGEVVDRLDKGQSPEQIDAAIPDLGDSNGE